MNPVLHALATTYSYNTSTSSSGGFSLGSGIGILVGLIVVVFLLAAMWKIFQKAGRHGWAAIIPIYSTWVLFEITGLPGWCALLSLIPLANIAALVMDIIALYRLPYRFGKRSPMGILNVLFPFIIMPILGFGSAQYQGSNDGSNVAETPYPTVTPPQTPTV